MESWQVQARLVKLSTKESIPSQRFQTGTTPEPRFCGQKTAFYILIPVWIYLLLLDIFTSPISTFEESMSSGLENVQCKMLSYCVQDAFGHMTKLPYIQRVQWWGDSSKHSAHVREDIAEVLHANNILKKIQNGRGITNAGSMIRDCQIGD